jgi:predicted AAA+ superfamily ATPase
MYIRSLESQIIDGLSKSKIVILYGARQVGKTTLAKNIAKKYASSIYLNCDDPNVVKNLTNKSAVELKNFIGNAELVIIDEAQRVTNIGISIKLIHDTYPEIKLLVTGSSSLDLANKIKEPLTGRSIELMLYPLSIDEVSTTKLEKIGNISKMLIYGNYPEAWKNASIDAEQYLKTLANNYIYRDAFNPDTYFDQTTINNLLQLLSFQLGNEVSYNELAKRLEIDKNTVKKYIDLLEKAFIIFRVNQFRKNERTVVGRLRKIYFYDLGVRNGIIDAFAAPELRPDLGALWENFCFIERIKKMQSQNKFVKYFYWRYKNNQEIDLIELQGENISAYEFKYKQNKKIKTPKVFSDLYPNVELQVINIENIFDSYI